MTLYTTFIVNMTKLTATDVLRKWCIYNHSGFKWLRYRNPPEKGIYWYWFSLYVRERDVKKWGKCISCGKGITMESCDAGHFMPAQSCGRDLLFDLLNVNAECGKCNAFDDTHLLGYADGLDLRYGSGTARSLRARKQDYTDRKVAVKDFTAKQYEGLIEMLPSYQHAKLEDAHVPSILTTLP